MKNKNANIVADKPILWILGIIVFASIIIFLMQIDLETHLRNLLPDFHLPKDDVVIKIDDNSLSGDSGAVGKQMACSGNKIGEIKQLKDGNYYIYLDGQNTNLIWKGDSRGGYITIGGKDVSIAKIKNGIISVDSEYFNYDSDEFQEIRFIYGANLNVFAKINSSFYYDGNKLCDTKKNLPKVDWGWYGEQEVFELKVDAKEKTADFSDYILPNKNSKIKNFYLVKRSDYLEIAGLCVWEESFFGMKLSSDSLCPDVSNLGMVRSDGSIWIDKTKLIDDKSSSKKIFWAEENEWVKDFRYNERDMQTGETKLRINNYDRIYQMFDKK